MRRAAVVAAVALAALVPAGTSRAAPTPAVPAVQRPNPVLTGIQLDYEAPLQSADGGTASLAPLRPAVALAAVRDEAALAYARRDDLGGFVPARIGATALAGGGRGIVGSVDRPSEIPLLARQAGGSIVSFGFPRGPGGGSGPPDNGTQPVPGLGVPTPTPAPGPQPPPANQGFGGRPGGGGNGGTPTPKPPPPPTTTTTPTTPGATTPTTTTATTASAPGGGGGGGPGVGGPECGVPGISIHSSASGCHIDGTNLRPGDSATELVEITNTSSSTYTLSLRASGTQNHLWQDLRMAVYQSGTPPPSPLPPLLFWTTQDNDLTTLAPGQRVTYVVELYLPTTVGNVDQALAAVIDFEWRATG